LEVGGNEKLRADGWKAGRMEWWNDGMMRERLKVQGTRCKAEGLRPWNDRIMEEWKTGNPKESLSGREV